jgi:hypothetical protein
MEVTRSSETSVFTRAALPHILEDGILHSYRRDNLKSYIDIEELVTFLDSFQFYMKLDSSDGYFI